ncbi:hypothetical protein [Comamonas thiooxydans]|uniref:hypothetical protein n=1 Tax=Comamonas thiooxydans TaxID=363952 RepID=UPI0011854BD1|nr:hypothetical protein [Comamonas thiooxydans]
MNQEDSAAQATNSVDTPQATYKTLRELGIELPSWLEFPLGALHATSCFLLLFAQNWSLDWKIGLAITSMFLTGAFFIRVLPIWKLRSPKPDASREANSSTPSAPPQES